MFNPKHKALAFRIYAFCVPREWDTTASEIADALGVTYQAIGTCSRLEGWSNRIRNGKHEYSNTHGIGFDEFTFKPGL